MPMIVFHLNLSGKKKKLPYDPVSINTYHQVGSSFTSLIIIKKKKKKKKKISFLIMRLFSNVLLAIPVGDAL